MNKFKKFSDNIEIAILCVMFSVLLLFMLFQIITRYFFGFTLAWTEQICRLFFVYISFAGISYGAMKLQHLRVTALPAFFKGNAGKIILLFGDAVTVVAAFYLAWRVGLLTYTVFQRNQSFVSMPWMPIWVMYLSGALGMLGMGIRTLQFGVIPPLKELIKGSEK